MKKQITINNVSYSGSGLVDLIEEKLSDALLPDWEREVYEFIREWFGNKESVEVRTSGTTGEPRKYKVSKKAMLVSARKTIDFFNLKPGDTALLCLSPKYIAGKLMIVRAVEGDLNLLLSEPSSTPLEDLAYDVDFLAMVPMQVQKQLEKNKDAFSKVKKLIIGGGEVSPALKEKLQEIRTEVWETYGMTETLTHIALKKINGENSSDWFEPLPGVELSKTTDGRLVVGVEGITDGKLETNDIVEFNGEKKFRILGRADDVINTGGIKVMPQKVEQKLELFINRPLVISSLPDEVLCEKIILVIEGRPFDREKLTEKFKLLEFYERPKEILFLEEFPRTGSGKIKRKEIKKIIKEKL
jgi:O-succinylbenzoic acid--CoA ligase